MPNIAAMINQSTTTLCANKTTTKEQKNFVEDFFKNVGDVFWNDEKLMNVNIALGSCGVAYSLLMMESLEKEAIRQGLSKQQARVMTIKLFSSSAHLVKETNLEFETLRHRVTTPNGVTEAGILHLQENHVPELFAKTIPKAIKRCTELMGLFSKSGSATQPKFVNIVPAPQPARIPKAKL